MKKIFLFSFICTAISVSAQEQQDSIYFQNVLDSLFLKYPLEVYQQCLDKLEQMHMKEPKNVAEIKQLGFAIRPLGSYQFNYAQYNNDSTITDFSKCFMIDSSFSKFASLYKGEIIGTFIAKKDSAGWHISSHSMLFTEYDKDKADYKAIQKAFKHSSKVFTIRTANPYAYGYIEDKKIKLISYYYGQYREYNSLSEWRRKLNAAPNKIIN